MSVVTEQQVQQWLGSYKITIDDVDDELENTAKTQVFSALSSRYSTSEWVSYATTPKLVQQVISMLIAAWLYARIYSEDDVSISSYATSLEARANALLQSIANGQMLLAEVEAVVKTTDGPSFYPMDNSVEDDGYTPVGPKFGMGSVY